MADQRTFDFSAETKAKAADRLPWLPSAAAAHVMGLTRSLEALHYSPSQIIEAYKAEIQYLRLCPWNLTKVGKDTK